MCHRGEIRPDRQSGNSSRFVRPFVCDNKTAQLTARHSFRARDICQPTPVRRATPGWKSVHRPRAKLVPTPCIRLSFDNAVSARAFVRWSRNNVPARKHPYGYAYSRYGTPDLSRWYGHRLATKSSTVEAEYPIKRRHCASPFLYGGDNTNERPERHAAQVPRATSGAAGCFRRGLRDVVFTTTRARDRAVPRARFPLIVSRNDVNNRRPGWYVLNGRRRGPPSGNRNSHLHTRPCTRRTVACAWINMSRAEWLKQSKHRVVWQTPRPLALPRPSRGSFWVGAPTSR